MPKTKIASIMQDRPAKERVMIGLPTLNHYLNAALLSFSVSLTKAPDNRAFDMTIVDGAQPVDFARNKICQLALGSDMDRLWMIDYDTCPPSNAMEMLDVDADIVLGLVPVFKGSPNGNPGALYFNVYTYASEKDKMRPLQYLETAPEGRDIDAGGCASIIIRRKVLEDPRMRYDDGWVDIEGTERRLDPQEPPAIFRMKKKPNGEILIGEDMDFCLRAKGLGYSVKYYAGTQFGHIKNINLLDMMVLQNACISKGREQAMAQQPEAVGA